MIEAEASVEIDRAPERVWDYMVRFDNWWLASNPDEHIALSAIDPGEIAKGTRSVSMERVAGIRGEAIATIRDLTRRHAGKWNSA